MSSAGQLPAWWGLQRHTLTHTNTIEPETEVCVYYLHDERGASFSFSSSTASVAQLRGVEMTTGTAVYVCVCMCVSLLCGSVPAIMKLSL